MSAPALEGALRCAPESSVRRAMSQVRDAASDPVTGSLALSPRQAARSLGVSPQTLYNLLNAGRIRSVKVGRRRLIPVAELARFLQEAE